MRAGRTVTIPPAARVAAARRARPAIASMMTFSIRADSRGDSSGPPRKRIRYQWPLSAFIMPPTNTVVRRGQPRERLSLALPGARAAVPWYYAALVPPALPGDLPAHLQRAA